MYTLLMVLFVILCLFLSLFVLIQQGKGDMGLGSIGRGSQQIFGGSGGQDFFEKATWTLGGLFMVGALGLTIAKSDSSRLVGRRIVPVQEQPAAPQQPAAPAENTPLVPKN